MRDRDCRQPTALAQRLHRRIVDQADAVPHDVAHGRLRDQRALADRHLWPCRDLKEARLEVLDDVPPTLRHQLLEGGPLLAIPADVLPLVLADRAVLRRRLARRVLHAARAADERWHLYSRASGDSRRLSGVGSEGRTRRQLIAAFPPLSRGIYRSVIA